MDQPIDSRVVAEALSEGMNTLYAIAEEGDASQSAVLSQFRDALVIFKNGVKFSARTTVDEEMIPHLDAVIAAVHSGPLTEETRGLARSYLAELAAKWAPPPETK